MKKLMILNDVIRKIESGERLVLAADENLLAKLPKGNWIAGTIPYFMDENGGVFSKEKIFVNQLPEFAKSISIKSYDENTLPFIANDEFENGYSLIIMPAKSKVHISFAENSHKYQNIFLRPLVGWVSGTELKDIDVIAPKVYNGETSEVFEDKCVVMHIELPKNKAANLDIINLFEQSDGDIITFESTGFVVTDCKINGEPANLAKYIVSNKIDTKVPLVADYCGAMINTSFHFVDAEKGIVSFFAPVFEGYEYKIAKSVDDYVKQFLGMTTKLDINPVFTCNCLLNYVYSELEGKKTGKLTGPMTYGEIAYQLLNQTLVYLNIEEISTE